MSSNRSLPIDILPLEPRRLLAASVTFANGTLTIVGTYAPEQIIVQPATGDPTSASAYVDGVRVQTVPLSGLSLISIDGGSGDDLVKVDVLLKVKAELRGGYGDDTVRGGGGDDYVAGEKGNDKVYGGPGNDLLTAGAGKNYLYCDDGNDKAIGSSGRDIMYGGSGKDTLYGNNGDDFIDGGGGNDSIWGGSGYDYLLGGTGDDRIYGNSEADTLGGGVGADTLVGGENAGTDVAYADSKDRVSQCEIVK